MKDYQVEVCARIGWRDALDALAEFVEHLPAGAMSLDDAEKLAALAKDVRVKVERFAREQR